MQAEQPNVKLDQISLLIFDVLTRATGWKDMIEVFKEHYWKASGYLELLFCFYNKILSDWQITRGTFWTNIDWTIIFTQKHWAPSPWLVVQSRVPGLPPTHSCSQCQSPPPPSSHKRGKRRHFFLVCDVPKVKLCSFRL